MNKNNSDYYNQCPICASENIRDKYKLKRYLISECLNCSVLFVKEILTMDFLKKHYDQLDGDFVYEVDNEKCINYYYQKIKSEIEKAKPNKGSILDVGCSSGLFLNQMKGWERHGVEISKKMGAVAKEKIGANILIKSFEEYPIKYNYFDVITLQDVFDHFISPHENLKKCYAMLKPGGLLVIKVHNISCLYARITGANFYAIVPPSHLFYFNEKALKIVLDEFGFKIYKSRFIGQVLQLKTLFHRLAREKTNTMYYKLYKFLGNNMLGKIKIYKNLNDIITVFAIKQEGN